MKSNKVCVNKQSSLLVIGAIAASFLVISLTSRFISTPTSTTTKASDTKEKIVAQVLITPTPLVFVKTTTPGENFAVPASALSVAIAAGDYSFDLTRFLKADNIRPALQPITNVGLTATIEGETWYGYIIRFPNGQNVIGYSEKMQHVTYFLTTNPPTGTATTPVKTMWMKVSASTISDETLNSGTYALRESVKLLGEDLVKDKVAADGLTAIKKVFPNYFEPYLRYIDFGDGQRMLARFTPDFYVSPGSGYTADVAGTLFDYGRAVPKTKDLAGKVLQTSYDDFYRLAMERGIITFDAHLGNFIYVQGPNNKLYSFLFDIDTPNALTNTPPFEYMLQVTDHFQDAAKANGFKLQIASLPENYMAYKGNVVARVALKDGTVDMILKPSQLDLVKGVMANQTIDTITAQVGIDNGQAVIISYQRTADMTMKKVTSSMIGIGGRIWSALAKGAPVLWFLNGAVDIDSGASGINLSTDLYIDQARTNNTHTFTFSSKMNVLFDQLDAYRKNLTLSALTTLQKCPAGYLTPTPLNMVVGGSGIYPNYCLATDKMLDERSRQLIQFTFGESIDTISKAAYSMGKTPAEVYSLINKGIERSEMPFPVFAKFAGGLFGSIQESMFDSLMVSAVVDAPYGLITKTNERALLVWTKSNGSYVPSYYVVEQHGLSASYEVFPLSKSPVQVTYTFNGVTSTCDMSFLKGNKKTAELTLVCK